METERGLTENPEYWLSVVGVRDCEPGSLGELWRQRQCGLVGVHALVQWDQVKIDDAQIRDRL
jgi:hypothetical protein